MTTEPIQLDPRRGLAAQRDTLQRRRRHDVAADQAALKLRHDELEKFLLRAPASSLLEVAAKAKYLIQLFASTAEAQQPHRQALIAASLNELNALFDSKPPLDERGNVAASAAPGPAPCRDGPP
jgi:hypothetical protein